MKLGRELFKLMYPFSICRIVVGYRRTSCRQQHRSLRFGRGAGPADDPRLNAAIPK